MNSPNITAGSWRTSSLQEAFIAACEERDRRGKRIQDLEQQNLVIRSLAEKTPTPPSTESWSNQNLEAAGLREKLKRQEQVTISLRNQVKELLNQTSKQVPEDQYHESMKKISKQNGILDTQCKDLRAALQQRDQDVASLEELLWGLQKERELLLSLIPSEKAPSKLLIDDYEDSPQGTSFEMGLDDYEEEMEGHIQASLRRDLPTPRPDSPRSIWHKVLEGLSSLVT